VSSREERRWQHHDAAEKMRKVRKQIKHNRESRGPRCKEWMPASLDDLDEFDDSSRSERVMPRGERERRREIWKALAALEEEAEEGTDADEEGLSADGTLSTSGPEEAVGQRGVVVEVSSSLCRVDVDGRSLMCGIRGSLSAQDTGFTNVVAVGDEVVISQNGSDQGVVEAVLPRRSVLARPDVFSPHLRQVIAANVDQLLIVASWREPHLWPELVDRYLITAERNNLVPIICVNKVDLAEDEAACRAALQPYVDLGYRVLFTSARTGEGIGRLRKVLHGKMTVVAGLSGVGKSSLLAAVQPGLQLRVGEVSEYSRQGQHTTAQVSLLKLQAEGAVIDTPGIREFGLSGLGRAELVRFYPEIAAVQWRCRFNDCSHTHEPGCAVKVAVGQGLVSEMRYHSYEKIYHTLEA